MTRQIHRFEIAQAFVPWADLPELMLPPLRMSLSVFLLM